MPHYDEVRESKSKSGREEKSEPFPRNEKTMGGAERLNEGDARKVSQDSRADVNSEHVHLSAARAHAHAMETHCKYLENTKGGSPNHDGGLNNKRDAANTEYTSNPLQSVPLP